MFRKIEKENPFEEILDQIIDNIKEGTLKKGDALPAERNMAEALGVSRPVVREVLRTLAVLGIIKSVHGGANYVSEKLENSLIEPLSILLRLNNSSVYHNQQLRSALEIEASRLAARNCTPVDAAELQLLLARLDAAEEESVRGDLDRDLHIKIGKMAQNPMLFSVMSASAQLTENIITGIRSYMMQKQKSVSQMDEQHRKLVNAIVEHREEDAEICMKEHMRTIENYILEIDRKKDKQV
ncbi:FadR/GntR family transcriptional regulator [Blautia sp. Marseille-P3201T]|mgnify:FL=1|uniref:FadR/GntR family transcriptional regulator n=1 Tax=Blautia sp. Marseille-P3201T TaxID=1907659 RepID=UPI000930608F|nr:FadR/GntR family transcriptional regulator [Blautia sp. Marseille-P3201T]